MDTGLYERTTMQRGRGRRDPDATTLELTRQCYASPRSFESRRERVVVPQTLVLQCWAEVLAED